MSEVMDMGNESQNSKKCCFLPEKVIHFFEKQHTVIVSTLDADGGIHTSAKGIVRIEPQGRVCVVDVYKQRTYQNLLRNPTVALTAIDDHSFVGYCLKGTALIKEKGELDDHIFKKWESRIISRISTRVIKNLQNEKKTAAHPEMQLPDVEHAIQVNIHEIVDLAPQPLKNEVSS
ncbi:MAG: pyridoxamine 5'-phosphate oxidase family protein [Candidatus Omnitrophica bacterium]|nr:pyridoxamine 5'-phosphate oxidase family protein [Candidatus Omnitrophota bacterium]